MTHRERRIIFRRERHPLDVQLPGDALKEPMEIDYPRTIEALHDEVLYPDRVLQKLLTEAEAARLRASEGCGDERIGGLRSLCREVLGAVLETFKKPPLPGLSGENLDRPQRPNHALTKWDRLVMELGRELRERPERRKREEEARLWRWKREHGLGQ